MPDPRYTVSSGSVFSLKYHFVWCSKYRRKVLTGQIAEALKAYLYEKAAQLDVNIEALEIIPDHVHLFVSSDPSEAPQRLANQFKGYTSRKLRQEYAELRSRIPSLWSRSYYVGSVGQVSEETVKKYIADQKGK